jgi:hypothetical protein
VQPDPLPVAAAIAEAVDFNDAFRSEEIDDEGSDDGFANHLRRLAQGQLQPDVGLEDEPAPIDPDDEDFNSLATLLDHTALEEESEQQVEQDAQLPDPGEALALADDSDADLLPIPGLPSSDDEDDQEEGPEEQIAQDGQLPGAGKPSDHKDNSDKDSVSTSRFLPSDDEEDEETENLPITQSLPSSSSEELGELDEIDPDPSAQDILFSGDDDIGNHDSDEFPSFHSGPETSHDSDGDSEITLDPVRGSDRVNGNLRSQHRPADPFSSSPTFSDSEITMGSASRSGQVNRNPGSDRRSADRISSSLTLSDSEITLRMATGSGQVNRNSRSHRRSSDPISSTLTFSDSEITLEMAAGPGRGNGNPQSHRRSASSSSSSLMSSEVSLRTEQDLSEAHSSSSAELDLSPYSSDDNMDQAAAVRMDSQMTDLLQESWNPYCHCGKMIPNHWSSSH